MCHVHAVKKKADNLAGVLRILYRDAKLYLVKTLKQLTFCHCEKYSRNFPTSEILKIRKITSTT